MNFFFPPDFHFASSYWAFLLLLAIPVGILFYQTVQKKRGSDRLFQQKLYNERREVGDAFSLFLTGFCLIFCLMEPEGFMHRTSDPLFASAHLDQPLPILFLLDNSLSMTTPDAPFNKSRFEEAKEIIASFLPRIGSIPTALFTFEAQLQPLIPTTLDSTFMELSLDILTPVPSPDGTNFLTMLSNLQSYLATKDVIKPRQIVLLSDGEDTDPHPDIPAMQKIVSALAQEGIHFTVIGIGTSEGMAIPNLTYNQKPIISHLNRPLLEALATSGKGLYIDPYSISVSTLIQNLSTQFAQNTYQKLYVPEPLLSYLPLYFLFLLIGFATFLRKF